MAIVAITAADMELGGTDYSSEINDARLNVEVETHDVTDFESGGWKEFIGGAKSATLTFSTNRDTDTSGLNSYLWTNLGVSVAFKLIGDGGSAIATTNAEFQGNCIVTQESFGTAVNTPWQTTHSFPVTGSVTRDTTP